MKYFKLTVDKHYTPPIPIGWYGILDRKTLEKKRAYQMPKHMLFYVESHMQMVFTDVVTFPCFMVSKMIRDVIEKYDPFVRFARVILYDRERKNSMPYYIPFLSSVQTAGGDDVGKETVAEDAIPDSELRNHVIAELKTSDKACVVIRLDLAESILRRGAVGVGLEEL